MIRFKPIKNAVIFFTILAVLFLLNNYFVSITDGGGTLRKKNRVEESANGSFNKDCPTEEPETPQRKYLKTVNELKCSADNGKVMRCLRDESEFYFPFSFIRKQFDVSGKMSKDLSRFEWSTSYSKMRVPEGTSYDPTGVFGHFSTYSVETRDRVRCISGETGVPMSTQWDPSPYYYPIQIAQYGLQHYSRLKSANASEFEEKLVGLESKEWKGSAAMHDTSERIFSNVEGIGNIVNISTTSQLANAGCYVFLDNSPSLHVISFDWLPYGNASFTILVKIIQSDTLVLLNYVTESDTRCVWNDSTNIGGTEQVSFSISLGPLNATWNSVTRDALVDAARALSSSVNGGGKKKDSNVILHPGDIKLVSLGFRGEVSVRTRVMQSSQAHEKFFIRAAEWMVENQDKQGGWPVPVERSMADGKMVLPAGWHSSMAQGHGISLLTRAFHHTSDVRYLHSAIRGLELYNKSASEGGVRNDLFGYAWYEEYPTTPGSFVLNGFIYSLIGLFDLSKTELKEDADHTLREGVHRADLLFMSGLSSLRTFLPFYDTGSGTVYDLRHVGLAVAPNLARWDYHAVHVYLLKWLVQITGDEKLNETADRWIGYSYGKRAKHN